LHNTSLNSSDDNTLNIYGVLYASPTDTDPVIIGGQTVGVPLKVNGDISLTVDSGPNMTVNVVSDDYNNTVIMPFVDQTPTATGGAFPPADHANILFNVAAGKTITVNVGNELEFRGLTPGSNPRGTTVHGAKLLMPSKDKALLPLDMVLIFAGEGQTIFNMAEGISIKFMGDIDLTSAVDVIDNTFTNVSDNAAGTKVFITMEQTKADVEGTSANPVNKVLFRQTANDFSVPANTDLRNLVYVGPNSIITLYI